MGLICQAAEHQFAGVPCGIMDQFASIFGRESELIKIDCMDQSVELIPSAKMEELSFLVINTLASHALVDGEYAARKQQCVAALEKIGKTTFRQVTIDDLDQVGLSEIEVKRARHVVTEIQRTMKCVKLISSGQWSDVGDLMYESHHSLKNDFEVSCIELDFLVEQCQTIGMAGGIVGSRMTGGGFGGCTITLARRDKIDTIVDTLQKNFHNRFGRIPPVFATSPSDGARLI